MTAPKPPRFWHLLLSSLFGVTSAHLRVELWKNYSKSTVLVWQLARCGELAATPEGRGGAHQALEHLAGATVAVAGCRGRGCKAGAQRQGAGAF